MVRGIRHHKLGIGITGHGLETLRSGSTVSQIFKTWDQKIILESWIIISKFVDQGSTFEAKIWDHDMIPRTISRPCYLLSMLFYASEPIPYG